jgi:hypothetical protein
MFEFRASNPFDDRKPAITLIGMKVGWLYVNSIPIFIPMGVYWDISFSLQWSSIALYIIVDRRCHHASAVSLWHAHESVFV